MRNIEQHNLFVNTKPGRLFLKAALPGAIGMLASAMYQTLDGVFVGRFLGSTAFAAINLAMPFVIINFSLADLIGVGSSVPISIALGEGRGEDANKIFSLAIVLIFLAGLAIGGLLFFAAPLLIALMGAEGEFASQAVMYMRTYAMLSPFTTMMFASDNFLRICGKIRTSMSLNIFMSLFGATVEFLFLAVFGFGIWAAALANCLAMMTTTMLSMLPFLSKKLALRFVRPCGLPSFLNNIAGRLTSIVMNMMLVRFGGQNAVSVYGVLMYADGIIQPLMYGSCDSLQPAIGYNWGAGQYSRVRKIEKYCFSVAAGLCACRRAVCHGFPNVYFRPFFHRTCIHVRCSSILCCFCGACFCLHICDTLDHVLHTELHAGNREITVRHDTVNFGGTCVPSAVHFLTAGTRPYGDMAQFPSLFPLLCNYVADHPYEGEEEYFTSRSCNLRCLSIFSVVEDEI